MKEREEYGPIVGGLFGLDTVISVESAGAQIGFSHALYKIATVED